MFNSSPLNTLPFNADGEGASVPIPGTASPSSYLFSAPALLPYRACSLGLASNQQNFRAAVARFCQTSNPISNAERRDSTSTLLFRGSIDLNAAIELDLCAATPFLTAVITPFRSAIKLDGQGLYPFRQADRLGTLMQADFRSAFPRQASGLYPFRASPALLAHVLTGFRHSHALDHRKDLWFRAAYLPGPGLHPPIPISPPTGPPSWGGGTGGLTRTLSFQEYYQVSNTASVTLFADGSPIECKSLTIASDMQSWSRRFSGQVICRDIDKIRTTNGPVAIQITANGVTWNAVITQYQDNRRFGQDSGSFNAVSPSLVLAKPYAPLFSGILPAASILNGSITPSTSAAYASQIADAILTDTGWTLDWSPMYAGATVDWSIPPGIFSVSNAAPIDVIKQLAATIGAFVITDIAAAQIHVKSCYPIAPWNLATASPDISIPLDALYTMGGEWVQNATFNSQWLSGQLAGQCVQVQHLDNPIFASLTSAEPAAGAVYGPEYLIVDPLLTETGTTLSYQARGVSILAQSGARQNVSLAMPFFPEVGLIEPGYLVQVNDISGYSWIGVCLNSQIDLSWDDNGLLIKQTAVVEHWYGT